MFQCFLVILFLLNGNSKNELLSKISDQKKIKNIELITMISSTPLGINMLFYDQKASDLQRNIEDLRRNDK